MPEGNQDHGAVALRPAVALGRLDQLADLALGQVFARPDVGVGPPQRCDCPISLSLARPA